MAVTKNHPINSTLKKAIQYICNLEKTDGTLLIDSYGCTPETADIEFEWTRKKAKDNGKESHLARHFIQAFEPGETTPEQAHEIGKKLADEILGGKYEYILSTHIDRGHIHNHIIFNDVNFVDYRHSHINKKWYYDTRKISDRLCEEYGLSVIPQNDNKGKSYIEYTAAKTLNFLTENNLTTYEDLETAANKIHSDFDNTAQKINAVWLTLWVWEFYHLPVINICVFRWRKLYPSVQHLFWELRAYNFQQRQD